MESENGEIMTANAINDKEAHKCHHTNQYPAFVAYRRSTHVPTCLEARVHTHRSARTHSHVLMRQRQQALFCSPTLGIYVGYAQAYMYLSKIAVHIVRSQHMQHGAGRTRCKEVAGRGNITCSGMHHKSWGRRKCQKPSEQEAGSYLCRRTCCSLCFRPA